MSLTLLRDRYNRLRGRKSFVIDQLKLSRLQLAEIEKRKAKCEEARAVIQAVAGATQQQLEFSIASVVSLSMDVVLDNPYEVRVEFVPKRNRSETNIYFVKDGEEVTPEDAVGGGVIDVAAFGLRIAMWAMTEPRPRPVMLLDEPFRFVSRDLQSKAAALLKQLSERLGIQFIIITHEPTLVEEAVDRVFTVSITDGVSQVAADNRT